VASGDCWSDSRTLTGKLSAEARGCCGSNRAVRSGCTVVLLVGTAEGFPMATIVIVHGAGTGGWLWQRVRRLLQAAGHEMYTPTHTGVGERAHLAGQGIGLTTHIQDIAAVLAYEELSDVMLVGHSYGGMVISGVAGEAPERVAQLIYLDAFVPADGQAMFDFMPPAMRAAWEQQAQTIGDGWKVPPLAHQTAGRVDADGLSEAEIQQLLRRRLPQSLKTYTEPVRITNPAMARLPRTFIYCTDKPAGDPFGHIAAGIRGSANWRYHEMPTGHFPMLTMPHRLAGLLNVLAAPVPAPAG